MVPRIDHPDTATLEITHIAGSQGTTMGTRSGGDQTVGKTDRLTGGTTVSEGNGGGTVERHHTAREIDQDHGVYFVE